MNAENDPTFSKDKAAQYYIVAWVKDWRIQTYMQAIGAEGLPYAEIHTLYPWLPTQKDSHMYFKNCLIRAWTSKAMKVINDKLWDTDDNKKRLQLAKHVELWDSTGVKAGTIHQQDVNERRLALAHNRQSGMGHKVSVSLMRKANNWGTVK